MAGPLSAAVGGAQYSPLTVSISRYGICELRPCRWSLTVAIESVQNAQIWRVRDEAVSIALVADLIHNFGDAQ